MVPFPALPRSGRTQDGPRPINGAEEAAGGKENGQQNGKR